MLLRRPLPRPPPPRRRALPMVAAARSMFPAMTLPDLASVDASVTVMESQVQAIRRQIKEELDAIPKVKVGVLRSIRSGNAGDGASLSLRVPEISFFEVVQMWLWILGRLMVVLPH